MAYAPKRLYIGKPVNTGETVYVSGGERTIVKQIALTNTTDTQAEANVHLVPAENVHTAANALLYKTLVHPYSTVVVNLSQVLEDGDSLFCSQSTVGAITVTMSGVTYLT